MFCLTLQLLNSFNIFSKWIKDDLLGIPEWWSPEEESRELLFYRKTSLQQPCKQRNRVGLNVGLGIPER